MMVITRTKSEAEGSVKYECPERNDSLGKETKQPNLQKEERSDKSLRVVVVTKRGWVVNQINQTYFLKGLRMKKSVCLMAILGAFAIGANAAVDQSIDISFTGQVIEENCEVQLANGSNALNLGSMMKGAKNDTKGTVVPLLLKLSKCGGTLQTVSGFKLVNDLSTENYGNTNIKAGTLSTNQAGVVVQFYSDADGATPAAPSLIGKPTIATQTATVLGGYAAMLRKGAVDLKTGPVTAKGMFVLSYN